MFKTFAKFLNQYGPRATILVTFITALVMLYVGEIEYIIASLLGGWIMFGLSMIVQHRFVSHGVFKPRNKFIEYMLYSWTVLFAAGSPLSWAYSHRIHHVYTDEYPDAQSPKTVGYLKTFFAWAKVDGPFRVKIVKDLLRNKSVMFVHTYYYIFLLLYTLILLLISPLLFGYICVSIAISYAFLGTLNTWAHSGDDIINLPVKVLFFGEEDHAYHHISKETATVVDTSDYDLEAFIIKYFLADNESLSYRKEINYED